MHNANIRRTAEVEWLVAARGTAVATAASPFEAPAPQSNSSGGANYAKSEQDVSLEVHIIKMLTLARSSSGAPPAGGSAEATASAGLRDAMAGGDAIIRAIKSSFFPVTGSPALLSVRW